MSQSKNDSASSVPPWFLVEVLALNSCLVIPNDGPRHISQINSQSHMILLIIFPSNRGGVSEVCDCYVSHTATLARNISRLSLGAMLKTSLVTSASSGHFMGLQTSSKAF